MAVLFNQVLARIVIHVTGNSNTFIGKKLDKNCFVLNKIFCYRFNSMLLFIRKKIEISNVECMKVPEKNRGKTLEMCTVA